LCLFNVRLVSPQRCSPSRNGRFARPSARSMYTSTFSGRSPAQIGSFSKAPRRWVGQCGVCVVSVQCAACFAATVLTSEKWPLCASLRPLRVHKYAVGSQPCANRLIFEASAPLAAAKQAALGHFGYSARRTAVLARARSSRSRSPRLSSRRIHPRKAARDGVAGRWPSVLSRWLCAAPAPNRFLASRSTRLARPRPRLTAGKEAFLSLRLRRR
jgi:hypothetical protein